MSGEDSLVPIVAHGARMSWTGILRPGDQFPLPRRSRLAALSAASGSSLRRRFGSWSERYRRFTTNLSSAQLDVRIVRPEESDPDGILGLVHWLEPTRFAHSGPGSVPAADGWSPRFWDSFLSILDRWPTGNVAEKLWKLLERPLEDEPPPVTEWRSLVRRDPAPAEGHAGGGWIPIPATLHSDRGTTRCLVSWDPRASSYGSLSEALSSDEGRRRGADPESQARYYLECRLGTLHGVRFGALDAIEDLAYARSSSVEAIQHVVEKLERERLTDPNFGSLSVFERQSSG